MKAAAHPQRLSILRHLASGEKSVGMLELLLQKRQAAVSQQLARLRQEGLVVNRRDGKAIHYSLATPQVEHFVRCMQEAFRRQP
nr:metalloregulator ArsR/SmtB family transcription factor [Halovulum dunhuangense]